MRNCIVNHISFFWIPYQNYTKLLRFNLIPFSLHNNQILFKMNSLCLLRIFFNEPFIFKAVTLFYRAIAAFYTRIFVSLLLSFLTMMLFSISRHALHSLVSLLTPHTSWRLLVDVANIYRITGISVFVKLPIEHKSKLYRS